MFGVTEIVVLTIWGIESEFDLKIAYFALFSYFA